MGYNLILTSQAQGEIIDIVDYYDAIDPELGNRFLDEMQSIYSKLIDHPQYYSFVHNRRSSNIRDIKLKSFPYVVVFEIRETDVMIISVKNTFREG